jgi:hypothetical protein
MGRPRQRGPENKPVIPACLRGRMTGLLLAAAGGGTLDVARPRSVLSGPLGRIRRGCQRALLRLASVGFSG